MLSDITWDKENTGSDITWDSAPASTLPTITWNNEQAPTTSQAPEEAGLTLSDFGNEFMKSSAGLYEAGGWGLEKLGDIIGSQGLQDYGTAVRDTGTEASQFWGKDLSPTAKNIPNMLQRDAEGDISVGDTLKHIATNPAEIAYKVTGSLPATGLGMGAGGLFTKGFTLLPHVGTKIASMFGYGLGEGSVAGVTGGLETEKEILNMSHEKLMEHPSYRAVFGKIGDEREAKKVIAKTAGGDTGALTFVTTTLLSAPFGYVMSPIFNPVKGQGKGFLRDALIGGGEELTQETLQSGSEKALSNLAVQRYADQERKISEGVPEAMVEGGVTGFTMGTVAGGGQSLMDGTPDATTPQVPPSDANVKFANAINETDITWDEAPANIPDPDSILGQHIELGDFIGPVKDAMPNVNMNPEVHKDKGVNAMFVGANPEEEGAFSDTADKQTKRWISDENSEYTDEDLNWEADFDDLMTGKNPRYIASGPLGKAFKHPELFEKYPWLDKIDFILQDMAPNEGGYTDVANGMIVLNKNQPKHEVHSSLLHEVQHLIQKKEGFASGGSNDSVHPLDMIETLRIKFGNLPVFDSLDKSFLNGNLTEGEYYEQFINKGSQNYDAGGWVRLQFDTYKRLAGEQESRAVQSAQKHPDMTPYDALALDEGGVEKPIVNIDGDTANYEYKPTRGSNTATHYSPYNFETASTQNPNIGRTGGVETNNPSDVKSTFFYKKGAKVENDKGIGQVGQYAYEDVDLSKLDIYDEKTATKQEIYEYKKAVKEAQFNPAYQPTRDDRVKALQKLGYDGWEDSRVVEVFTDVAMPKPSVLEQSADYAGMPHRTKDMGEVAGAGVKATPTVTVEATPSNTNPLYEDLVEATPEERLAYEKAHIEPVKKLAKKHGLEIDVEVSLGAYEGQTNPMMAIEIKNARFRDMRGGNFDVIEQDKIDAFAKEFGIATDQDSVAWYAPVYKGNQKGTHGSIEISETLDATEWKALYDSIQAQTDAIIPIMHNGRIDFMNFGEVSGTEFAKVVSKALNGYNGDKITGAYIDKFNTVSNYIEKENYESEVQRSESRPSDLSGQEGDSDFQTEVQAIQEGFGKRNATKFTSKLKEAIEQDSRKVYTKRDLYHVAMKKGKEVKQGLLPSKGVKEDEIKWSGVKALLDSMDNTATITKQDLLNKLQSLEIEKVTKHSQGTSRSGEEWMQMVQDAERRGDWTEAERLQQEWEDVELQGSSGGDTKYQNYTTQDVDGTNYRETLNIKVNKPKSQKAFNAFVAKMEAKYGSYDFMQMSEAEKAKAKELNSAWLRENEALPKDNSYKSGHWDEANVLYETRTQDVDIQVENPEYIPRDEVIEYLDFDKNFEVVEKDGYWKVYDKITKIEYLNSYKIERLKESGIDTKEKFKAEYLKSKEIKQMLFNRARTTDQTRKYNTEKSLHAEEIQSDWHQAGREKGYKTSDGEDLVAFREEMKAKYGDSWYQDRNDEEIAKDNELLTGTFGVPEAPYSKTWHEKAMKDLIAEAVEKNYDRVSWTSGETQADRYSLASQVESIEAYRNKRGQWNLLVDTTEESEKEFYDLTDEALADTLGKEMASKIIEDEGGHYSGLDLEIGGEGMKGFYDKMLVNWTKKYIKQFKSKVEVAKLSDDTEVWTFKVTPEMKHSVGNKGQYLYANIGTAIPSYLVDVTEVLNDMRNSLDSFLSKHLTGKIKGTRFDNWFRKVGGSQNGLGLLTRDQETSFLKHFRKLQSALAKSNLSAEDKAKRIEEVRGEINEELFNKGAIRYLENPKVREQVKKDFPEVAKALDEVRDYIDQLSQEAMERGLLLPSQFNKWKDKYLSRLYMIESNAKDMKVGDGIKMFEMKKGRKIESIVDYLEENPAEAERLNAVLDPEMLVKMTIAKTQSNIGMDDFFRGVVDFGGLVEDELLVHLDTQVANLPKSFSPAYAESVVIPYIKDSDMEGKAELIKDIKEKILVAQDNIKNVDMKDKTTIPTGYRYGSLSGLPVTADVGSLIESQIRMVHDPEMLADRMDNAFAKALSYFKWAKVPANIFAYPRNYISNFFQWAMSTGNPVAFFTYSPRALWSWAKKDKWYRMAQEAGMLDTNLVSAEIGDMMKAIKPSENKSIASVQKGMQKVGHAFGWVDDMVKLAHMMYSVEKQGLTPAEAVNVAQEAHFDYTLTYDMIRAMRNPDMTRGSAIKLLGTLFPTYTQKVIAFLYDTIINRPATLVLMGTALAMLMDDDDDNTKALEKGLKISATDAEKLLEEVKGDKPEWMQYNPLIKTTLDIKGGKVQVTYTDYSYSIPFGSLITSVNAIADGAVGEGLGNLGLGGNPIQMMGDLRQNQDSFTGKQIYYEHDKVEGTKDLLAYAFKQLAPATFTKLQSLHDTRHPVLPRLIGINTYTYAHDELKLRRVMRDTDALSDAKKRTMTYIRKIQTAEKDMNEGKITKAEFEFIKKKNTAEVKRWIKIGEDAFKKKRD